MAGYHNCPYGDVSYFNNLFTREDLKDYEDCTLPVRKDGNVLDTLTRYRVTQEADGWYLEFTPSAVLAAQRDKPLVKLSQLADAMIPKQAFVMSDGRRSFDRDYFGKTRKGKGNLPGAFEYGGSGTVRVKVFDNGLKQE